MEIEGHAAQISELCRALRMRGAKRLIALVWETASEHPEETLDKFINLVFPKRREIRGKEEVE